MTIPRQRNYGPRHDYASILRYIIEYKRTHDGNSPTRRQIGAACGISSTSVVNYILERLENQGHLTLGEFGAIQVKGGQWQFQGER
jgi:hypothetical protein